MSHKLTIRLVFFTLVLALVGTASAQNAVLERGKRVVYNGKTVAIGDSSAAVAKLLGTPRANRGRSVLQYRGMILEIDAGRKVVAIEVSAPFPGATQSQFKIGSSPREAAAKDHKFAGARQGWSKGQSTFIFVDRGRIAKIRIGTPPAGLRTRRTPAVRPTKRPRVNPKKNAKLKRPTLKSNPKVKAHPKTHVPKARTPTRLPLTPRPGRNTPKNNRLLNNNGPNQRNQILIWDKSWRGSPEPRWLDAPTQTWPASNGFLLVRIAMDRGIKKFEQLICVQNSYHMQSRDYVYPAKHIRDQKKAWSPLKWQWRARGKGRARVQIIWFRTRNRLNAYINSNSYAKTFAFVERVDPWRQKVQLVWEKTWIENGSARLIEGPKERWPDKEGVLLLRAFGGPEITSFIYRPGIKSAIEVPLGDITLPVNILDRAKKNNLFGGLFGNARKKLHFAFKGRGPAMVRLYWIPEAKFVSLYCRENPINSINPWFKTPTAPGPRDWLYAGPQNWRDRDNYEGNWNQPLQPINQGQTNVAARAQGSLTRRSSRNRSLSRGSEFDAGTWFSNYSTYAFSESRFAGLARLDRIEIGSAGSDATAARYILVELEDENGRWQRIATFRNENINWHRLSVNRRGLSRPPIGIAVNPNKTYRAMRVVLAGDGPFRLAGIRAIGRFVGEVVYDDAPEFTDPGRQITIPANGGWVDSGGDVEAGRAVVIDIQGRWSLDSASTQGFGWSGPEGIAVNVLRNFFGSSSSHQAFRDGLPAPSLPAGALIGKIGATGRPILISPAHPMVFNESGHLYLGINDSRYSDNRGNLICTIMGAFFRHQLGSAPSLPSLVHVRCCGSIRSKSLNRPVSDVDVFLQLEPWPRTIFGGTRTDDQGRFEFTVPIPVGQSVLIGVPEFKLESRPKSFRQNGDFEFNILLN